MTAITFPNSPSTGDTHTAGNGIVYTYDGEKWTSIGTNSAGTWTRSGTTVSLTNAGDDLNVDSGTFFVDASTNNVGIGTTSPVGVGLNITGTTDSQVRLHTGNTGSTTSDGALFSVASNNDAYLWNYENNNFIFGTNNTERLRIDSSGRLLLGTTAARTAGAGGHAMLQVKSPAATTSDTEVIAAKFQGNSTVANSQCLIACSAGYSISANDTEGHALFGAVREGTGNAAGFILKTGTSNAERMRIDSAGQLLIKDANGGTFADFTTTSTRGEYNQTGTTQKIIFPNEFAAGNDDTRQKLYLFNSGSTRQAIGSGNNYDLTYHSSGHVANQAKHRFYVDKVEKASINTYGLTFNGDTAQANALDDYEEGTWTPSLLNGGTISSVNQASYTKIGRLVTAYLYLTFSSIPNNYSRFYIGNLPFVSASSSTYMGGVVLYTNTFNFSVWRPLVQTQSNYIYFHRTDGSNSIAENSSATGMVNIILQVSYIT